MSVNDQSLRHKDSDLHLQLLKTILEQQREYWLGHMAPHALWKLGKNY
jgi:hypothetical protein